MATFKHNEYAYGVPINFNYSEKRSHRRNQVYISIHGLQIDEGVFIIPKHRSRLIVNGHEM